jgi:WS/DGAT/MGAT family acyltransferase
MHRPIPLLDFVFLWIDRPDTPANVGALLLFEPPEGHDASRAVRQVLKAYRRARPVAPFDRIPDLPALGLPHWRPAGPADPRQHVLHHHLPGPGTLGQLHEFVAKLHQTQLDRSRPLYEVHLIDGLSSGQFAIYIKSHHATWDGRLALTRIFGSASVAPGAILPPFFAHELPQAMPDPSAGPPLVASVRSLLQQGMALRELFMDLAARAARMRERSQGPAGNAPFAGPHTRFNQPVRAERSLATFSLPLDRMRQVAGAFGGTVNDVVLAVVDAGVQRYLAARDERPRDPLVAMCPISQREDSDLEATIKVTTLFVRLGAPRAGIERRMAAIVASTAAAKNELRELSKAAALDYAMLAFGIWFASHTLGLGGVTRPIVNLVVSNVGGVPGERYLGRSRLVGAYPVSMVADPTGLNITSLSSAGRMDFGILADRAAVPDPDEIARHCKAAFARLQRATRSRGVRS